MTNTTVGFTCYFPPNGKKRIESLEVSNETKAAYDSVVSAGYHFEAELLTTGEVSLTCGDDDGDYVFNIVKAGDSVKQGSIDVITEAYERLKEGELK